MYIIILFYLEKVNLSGIIKREVIGLNETSHYPREIIHDCNQYAKCKKLHGTAVIKGNI